MHAVLAFDTATEQMSLAVAVADRVWTHDAAGGTQASATLIPAILALLAEAGTGLAELDAIAFGRGPGAFTGLRTACSVVQGLAFGAGKPVLPIDTLLALAEDARAAAGVGAVRLWALLDARMGELYAAHYAYADGCWQVLTAPCLLSPDALNARWHEAPPEAVAGQALGLYADRLQPGFATLWPEAQPRARALLPLARSVWQQGGAVDAALALPLYVRDKVAQTTVERDAAKLAKLEATS